MQQTGANTFLTSEVEEAFNQLGVPVREGREVAVDAIFDSVSVATTYREKLAEQGIIFCSFGGRSTTIGTGEKVSGHRSAGNDQLLCRAERRSGFGRHLYLCAEGRPLPDGAVDLFPHQRRKDRAV